MAISTLLSKPDLVSTHSVSRRQSFEKAVCKKVNEYFLKRWPWNSAEEKEAYLREDTELCSLLMCPQGPEDRAELTSAYIVFLFMYDDVLETMSMAEVRESVRSMRGVMLESQLPRNPIEDMMYDLCTRIRSLGDDYSHKLAEIAITEGIRFFEAVVNRDDRCKSLDDGLESYVRYRVKDVGFWTTTRMFAWQRDLATPPQYIWDDPDFISLRDLTPIHQLLVNDLYSYRREVKWVVREDVQAVLADTMDSDSSRIQGYSVFNAICALLQQDGVDENNVIEKMKELIDQNERQFKEVAARLRRRYKNDSNDLEVIDSWITFLTDTLAGNCIWSDLCRRYNSL